MSKKHDAYKQIRLMPRVREKLIRALKRLEVPSSATKLANTVLDKNLDAIGK